MCQSKIQTCRSKSYTDYTVWGSTPYILETLCINACWVHYTDYTDFRKNIHLF